MPDERPAGTPIESVIVLGTGRMAPGIASACAIAGAHVHIVGRNLERAQDAARRASSSLVQARPLEPAAFVDASLVVETIVEDAHVKRHVIAMIEPWLADDALIASNTSSIPIGALAQVLSQPERFAGLHFLNPADLTGVVEVVAGPRTGAAAVTALVCLAEQMGKKPLVVRRDAPGFIWNRLQFAVLRECLHLLDEGIADVEAIDTAVADGLAPRWLAAGPLATADLGGLETFRRAAAHLFPELASTEEVSPQLQARAAGGGGFYEWSGEARERIEQLRAELIVANRENAERRDDATPPPSPPVRS